MTGVFAVWIIELKRIFSLRPAFSVLILAIILYSIFYPQPYRNEALRDVPIVLVDLDGTESSRQFARRLDASADVAIASVLPDEASAEREVFARNLYGILIIPHYFERDLLHGRASPIALYADASYFLIYSRISGAVTALAKTVGAEVETGRLMAAHVDPAIAMAASDPMPLVAIPLFNPQGGYATYILPAAFVLLLQQILLIGVGLLGTYPNPELARLPAEGAGPGSRVVGKLLAYLTLQLAVFGFYLIVLPYLYGIPRLGSVGSVAVVSLPFIVAVASLAMVIAKLFRSPVVVQLVAAAIGMPFLFLAGFSWPTEAIPEPIRSAALVIPSTSAINALVNVGQLGATLSDVRSQTLTLGGLAVGYLLLAILLEALPGRKRRTPHVTA
ncbi:ABC transporter permease [Mesorhizobium sp. BH1-1-5]|uniref:ABC transporter permease n=1 Tax=Mesorhizobium sp. BH1-1-5 TaxID=2876661 RepID=UPI001CCCF66E|nr:ABC transporter permease [Mesorhizobium sp. BH1-1-5]MBZ9988163.1 ABC transporter permease [Mesorhizobium sp. BH1-1-5]